jgi:hypothetical protein
MSISGLKLQEDYHFQDKKSKGLIKDDPNCWRFIFENFVDDYHFLNSIFLFKCEGFGTGVKTFFEFAFQKFGPAIIPTLSSRVMINEINPWQINDITNWLKVFEEEFNHRYHNQIDKPFQFNYNNIIQGDAIMVKFPLEPDVILENQPYGSKKTYEIDSLTHRNTEDAFAHDSIKLLKGKKGRIYISLRPATFNNLDKCEDIRSLYVGKISDIVKGNNGWFKEGIKQPLVIKYVEGYGNHQYTLWEVPNGLPPYDIIKKTQQTFSSSKLKIITGYPDSEDDLTNSILQKIRNYQITFKSKGFEGKVGQGDGSRKSKDTLIKNNSLIVENQTSVYSEPVIVDWKPTKTKPQVWYREPKKTPLHDIKKSKIIIPRLMNQDATRPINWVVIDRKGTVGSALNGLLIQERPENLKTLAEVTTGDPFNACYSILRVGTSLSGEMLLSMPYIMSTDPDVWCEELVFTPEESTKFKNRCIKNKRSNPIHDYS